MLLFPCKTYTSNVNKLGFVITNHKPHESSNLRILKNNEIIDEVGLLQINNFIEIPISETSFKIQFQFFDKQEKTKFSISNITWGKQGFRRDPLCILHDRKCISNLNEKLTFFSKQTYDMNIENFSDPKDWHGRENKFLINGVLTDVYLAYVKLVQDYCSGIGVIVPDYRQRQKHIPYCYDRIKLKIIKSLDKIQHIDHFVKVLKINTINDYFEFIRSGYNLSLMSYRTYSDYELSVRDWSNLSVEKMK